MRTWFSTDPSEYFVSSRGAAASTASEIAIPRLPVESGCSARIARPASVSPDGLAMTCPPNAFRTGEDLVTLAPGESHVATWGIRVDVREEANEAPRLRV